MKPSKNKFWTLGDSHQAGVLVVKGETRMDNDALWKLIQGEWIPPVPVLYRYHMGASPSDLIATTVPGRYLLSNRILEVLKSARITGWSTYPIRILGRNGDELGGYHGFSVLGRAGLPDESRYQVVGVFPRGGFVRVRGLTVNEKTWDGRDVFLMEGTRHICISQPVYEAISALAPGNISLTPMEEVMRVISRERLNRRDDQEVARETGTESDSDEAPT
jgi:hypothetical protein